MWIIHTRLGWTVLEKVQAPGNDIHQTWKNSHGTIVWYYCHLIAPFKMGPTNQVTVVTVVLVQ